MYSYVGFVTHSVFVLSSQGRRSRPRAVGRVADSSSSCDRQWSNAQQPPPSPSRAGYTNRAARDSCYGRSAGSFCRSTAFSITKVSKRYVTLHDVSVHVISSDCVSRSRILAVFWVVYFMEGFAIRPGFSGRGLFFRPQNCVLGNFFNFPEMSVFLAFVSSHTQLFSDCYVRYFVVLVGHGATSELIFTINSVGSEGMLEHPGSGRLLWTVCRAVQCSGERVVRCLVRMSFPSRSCSGEKKM